MENPELTASFKAQAASKKYLQLLLELYNLKEFHNLSKIITTHQVGSGVQQKLVDCGIIKELSRKGRVRVYEWYTDIPTWEMVWLLRNGNGGKYIPIGNVGGSVYRTATRVIIDMDTIDLSKFPVERLASALIANDWRVLRPVINYIDYGTKNK